MIIKITSAGELTLDRPPRMDTSSDGLLHDAEQISVCNDSSILVLRSNEISISLSYNK